MSAGDACTWSQAVFGQLYTRDNVAISGIHTHSGPAGYLQYLLYDIPARGFVHETFNVLVNGIVTVSLLSAHVYMSAFEYECCLHQWEAATFNTGTFGVTPFVTQHSLR